MTAKNLLVITISKPSMLSHAIKYITRGHFQNCKKNIKIGCGILLHPGLGPGIGISLSGFQSRPHPHHTWTLIVEIHISIPTRQETDQQARLVVWYMYNTFKNGISGVFTLPFIIHNPVNQNSRLSQPCHSNIVHRL